MALRLRDREGLNESVSVAPVQVPAIFFPQYYAITISITILLGIRSYDRFNQPQSLGKSAARGLRRAITLHSYLRNTFVVLTYVVIWMPLFAFFFLTVVNISRFVVVCSR